MLFEMVAGAALAAGAQGATQFRTFDDTITGWSVVRRTDGCFAFSDVSATGINVFYKADLTGTPLVVLISNRSWRLREEQARGFRMQFVGAEGDWTDLVASTFQDNEDGEEGIIAMSFATDAIVPMMADISNASSLNFYRGTELLGSITLRNGDRAMRRLADCVTAVAGRPVPAPPAR